MLLLCGAVAAASDAKLRVSRSFAPAAAVHACVGVATAALALAAATLWERRTLSGARAALRGGGVADAAGSKQKTRAHDE